MKIAILGDTHFGARNSSKIFNDYFIKCYNEFYIPEFKKQGVTHILQLGDLFDIRKYTANYILKEVKEKHFNIIRDEGFEYHTLAGNHDLYWRESLEVVTQDLVLTEYDNIHVYTKPKTIELDGTTIDIIPWICKENSSQVFEFIKNSKSDLCIGHFEFAGFAMYRGQEANDGIDSSDFRKYELVLSGHYHTRSHKENVVYVGTPYEMTWQDYADDKGYHIFDTETRKLTFFKNPHTMFYRFEYDEKNVDSVDFSQFAGKYVRIVIVKKTDLYNFDIFMAKIYNANPVEVKIVEDLSDLQNGTIDDDINLEDTSTILSNYIDNLDMDVNKEALKTYMRVLYNEAVNQQV